MFRIIPREESFFLLFEGAAKNVHEGALAMLEFLKRCVGIKAQENEADRIEQPALASLFDNQHEPIEIIKWKDIYQDLETATDRCEDVANVLEGIVLKNA